MVFGPPSQLYPPVRAFRKLRYIVDRLIALAFTDELYRCIYGFTFLQASQPAGPNQSFKLHGVTRKVKQLLSEVIKSRLQLMGQENSSPITCRWLVPVSCYKIVISSVRSYFINGPNETLTASTFS